MRSWRQGTVGRLQLPDSVTVYTKCLKYPLLEIFASYDGGSCAPKDTLFLAFVDLEVLKRIDRIGTDSLNGEERKLGEAFLPHFVEGTSRVDRVEGVGDNAHLVFAEAIGNGVLTLERISLHMKERR